MVPQASLNATELIILPAESLKENDSPHLHQGICGILDSCFEKVGKIWHTRWIEIYVIIYHRAYVYFKFDTGQVKNSSIYLYYLIYLALPFTLQLGATSEYVKEKEKIWYSKINLIFIQKIPILWHTYLITHIIMHNTKWRV